MAPIKFEEHIKEKLDEREIQPSVASWEKLNSRLGNSNKGPGKKWWISAAAAVVVLLVASLFFIDQQNQTSIPIVEKPVDAPIEKETNNEFETPVEVASEEKKEEVRPEVSKQGIQKPVNERSKTEIAETNNMSSEKTEGLAFKNSAERNLLEPVSIDPPEMVEVSKNSYSDKIQELLAKVSQVEKESGDITEAEVDALLAEAVTEINGKRNDLISNKISADALLADAEEEVYESFKEKIFEMVKTGYQKAAVAVSSKLDQNQNQ